MRKKSYFAVTTLTAAILFSVYIFCLTVSAEELTSSDGNYDYIVLEDGTAMLTDYHGKGGDIIFPDKVDGCVISDMRSNLFNSCTDAPTSLSLNPDNTYFTIIDGVLFKKDPMKLVCYPRGLENTSYSIPEGTSIIGRSAFWWCSGLTSVSIPETVTVLEYGCFSNCDNITSITIPDSVASIEDWVFCATDIASITIPDSVTSFGVQVFTKCRSLTTIEVSDSQPVLSVSESVLFDKEQKELICYPAGLTAESYVIPNNVTSIATGAFRANESLRSVTIPDSVTEFGDVVFTDSEGVTLIVGENSKAYDYAVENGILYVTK